MTATLLNYTEAQLSEMPLAELKDICAEHQIEVTGHKGKKQTFIDAILNYQPKADNGGQFLLFDTAQFTVKPKTTTYNHYDLEDGDGFDFTEIKKPQPQPEPARSETEVEEVAAATAEAEEVSDTREFKIGDAVEVFFLIERVRGVVVDSEDPVTGYIKVRTEDVVSGFWVDKAQVFPIESFKPSPVYYPIPPAEPEDEGEDDEESFPIEENYGTVESWPTGNSPFSDLVEANNGQREASSNPHEYLQNLFRQWAEPVRARAKPHRMDDGCNRDCTPGREAPAAKRVSGSYMLAACIYCDGTGDCSGLQDGCECCGDCPSGGYCACCDNGIEELSLVQALDRVKEKAIALPANVSGTKSTESLAAQEDFRRTKLTEAAIGITFLDPTPPQKIPPGLSVGSRIATPQGTATVTQIRTAPGESDIVFADYGSGISHPHFPDDITLLTFLTSIDGSEEPPQSALSTAALSTQHSALATCTNGLPPPPIPWLTVGTAIARRLRSPPD